MNDLRALVDDATPDGAPGFDGVLARREQRSRRRRGTVVVVGAGIAAAVASVVVQLGTTDGDGSPAPTPLPSPTESSSPTPTQVDRPDPTYTWGDEPSRVVIRLPERDVTLTTWTGCWRGPTGNLDCIDEAPPPVAELPDVGSPDHIDFWFGGKGWKFSASFTQLGKECPRGEDAKAESTTAHWFRLDPAGLAGDYRVDLVGYDGREGDYKDSVTKMSFVWHTPSDGPLGQPEARVSVEDLDVSSLGFQPVSATAQVTVTDADGQTTTRDLPLDGDDRCEVLGGLYFQGDFDDPAIPRLGPGPYSYRVRLTLDGTRYVGTAGDDGKVTWSPPLPAYTG